MRYIDAGYAAALGALFVYGSHLWRRRHRLEQLASRMRRPPPP